MTAIFTSFLQKLKREPPFAAAVFTIFVFTVPVFISIIAHGVILLPAGYSSTLTVRPIYGVFALLINIALLFIFGTAPVFKARFHNIIAPDVLRKVLIYLYAALTFFSFFMINAKLDFINSLFADPVITILKAGSELDENNLLRFFFWGISGCIGFALVKKEDGIITKTVSFICMLTIVLFYFFLGRRELSIMTLCLLFLLKKDKISRGAIAITVVFVLAILVFVLSLRSGDESGSMFSTNSEELSTVAYSSYVIQKTTPDVIRSFTEATILRNYLIPSDISVAFIKADSGFSDPATPVLGIAGITYMYGFIIPFFTVFLFGALFRTVSNEFQKRKTAVIKLLLIYVVFRSFNLFRNGEFPIVEIDTIKFIILMLPALYLSFNKHSNDIVYEP